MKLYVDLETLQLIEGPGFRNPVTSLRFKRGDGALLELAFLDGGSTVVAIGDPAALEIRFGVKPRNRYEIGYLVQGSDWTMPAVGAESPIYQCSPSFNTLELNSALGVGSAAGSELSEITLMGEITWREGGGEPTSTRTFLIVVENDVNRGSEGVPVSASPAYPSPGAIEMITRKGLPNGYAGLNPSGKVPTAQLPPLVQPPSAPLGQLHALDDGFQWKGVSQGQYATLLYPWQYSDNPLPPNFRALAVYRLAEAFASEGGSLADLILQMESHHGAEFWPLVLNVTPYAAAGHSFHVVNAGSGRIPVGVGSGWPFMKTMIRTLTGGGEVYLAPHGSASIRFLSVGVVSISGDLYDPNATTGGYYGSGS